nr:tumor necrosis factor receptor superfamily member 6 [Taeniopygia guttata]
MKEIPSSCMSNGSFTLVLEQKVKSEAQGHLLAVTYCRACTAEQAAADTRIKLQMKARGCPARLCGSPGGRSRCPGPITAPGLPRGSGSAARPHGRPSPHPCRAVPCRAVPCRAVPCRAVPGAGRGGPGRACQLGRSRRRGQLRCPTRKVPDGGGMGNVRDGGGVARGLLALLLVGLFSIETQCKNDTEALITSNRRIISRREVNCKDDEYNLDNQCCKKCRSGFVKNVPCPTDTVKHCAPCEKGKEFMNHPNDLDKCFRCKLCDSNFGLEVVKNCTPEENTQCGCAKNYFCSPAGCDNCIQCSTCESGVIEKQCTPASDTVCGTKESEAWWIVLLVVLVAAAIGAIAAAIIIHKRKQKGLTISGVYKPEPHENEHLIYADADLSRHIPGIVAEMTLKEVKKFVRHHHMSEPAIDQSIQDCPGDTSEQKIRLFQAWYQSHGMKGAYGTLISSLRELKMCTVADKIEGKLRAAISSSQEGGQSYNPDTEQSKICTQEGRNSYNESAELSKIYTANLEET